MKTQSLKNLETRYIAERVLTLVLTVVMLIIGIRVIVNGALPIYYSIYYPTRVTEVTNMDDHIVDMELSDNGRYYTIKFDDTGDLLLNVPENVTNPVVVRTQSSNRYLRFGNRGYYVIDRSELNENTCYHLGKFIQYDYSSIESKMNMVSLKTNRVLKESLIPIAIITFLILMLTSDIDKLKEKKEEN